MTSTCSARLTLQGLATIDYVDARDNTKIGKGGNQGLDNGTQAWKLKQLDNGGVVRIRSSISKTAR